MFLFFVYYYVFYIRGIVGVIKVGVIIVGGVIRRVGGVIRVGVGSYGLIFDYVVFEVWGGFRFGM